MAPPWASLGLNGREMKKARTEAGRFLGDHPPKWDDMGSDRQKARSEEFLQHLRDTENGSIADKFMQGEETLLDFLRTRTKTIRNKKGSQPGSKRKSSFRMICSIIDIGVRLRHPCITAVGYNLASYEMSHLQQR